MELLFALISKIQFYHSYFFNMFCVATAVNNDTLMLRIYSGLSFLQLQTLVKTYLWCLQELQQNQGFGHINQRQIEFLRPAGI